MRFVEYQDGEKHKEMDDHADLFEPTPPRSTEASSSGINIPKPDYSEHLEYDAQPPVPDIIDVDSEEECNCPKSQADADLGLPADVHEPQDAHPCAFDTQPDEDSQFPEESQSLRLPETPPTP